MATRKPLVRVNGRVTQLPAADTLEGAGLVHFVEARNTTSPNDSTPAHSITALGAESAIDLVLATKGNGAILAQVPDGTTSGGDKRGGNAVDLQMTRTAADQVASGSNSFAAGNGNKSSGNASVAIGRLNVASGTDSSCFGASNESSGTQSSCFGGSNIADGNQSSCFGSSVTARGVTAAIAEGQGFALGRQQMRRIALRRDTTNATPFQLNSLGTTVASAFSSVVLPDNSAYYCRVRVLARNTATNRCKSWVATGLIRRGTGAGSTVLVGSTVSSEFGDAALSSTVVTLSADTTLGALAVVVTGIASTTIRWVAQVETVEAA